MALHRSEPLQSVDESALQNGPFADATMASVPPAHEPADSTEGAVVEEGVSNSGGPVEVGNTLGLDVGGAEGLKSVDAQSSEGPGEAAAAALVESHEKDGEAAVFEQTQAPD